MKNTSTDLIFFFAVVLILCAARCGAETPSTLIPISGPTTMTDDELRTEFLRHTHTHTHRDFEDRLSRLEERMNAVTNTMNALMRIFLDMTRKIDLLEQQIVVFQAQTGNIDIPLVLITVPDGTMDWGTKIRENNLRVMKWAVGLEKRLGTPHLELDTSASEDQFAKNYISDLEKMRTWIAEVEKLMEIRNAPPRR